MKSKTPAVYPLFIFLLASLVFIFLFTSVTRKYFFNENYVEAISGGIVEEIDEYNDSTYIKYQNNETGYIIHTELNYVSSELTIGTVFVMKYNITNPDDILVFETVIILMVLYIVFALLFIIAALITFKFFYLYQKNRNYCLENGRRTHAIVTDIKTNYNVNPNMNTLYCKTRDGKTLKTRPYVGEPYVFKPHHIVHVYVVPNTNKYYIDHKSYHSEEDDINFIEY